MLDPQRRWAHVGEKPDYAGFLSFCGLPYSEAAAELGEVDVAIVGAPLDELVSERPGARMGPRAIRAASAIPGPHLEAAIDPLAALRGIAYGGAGVLPAAPVRSHAAIEATVGDVVSAGAIPVVLGGDHSITEPDIRACAAVHGPVGLLHFDAHTDTAAECFGVSLSHGTPMYNLVQSGHVDPSRYVPVGLRGYWPGPEVFAWQRDRGITSIFMHDVTRRGLADVVAQAIAVAGSGPVFVTVAVDVLDPAFAPGTGTPEPGGMTSADLLWAVRTCAAALDIVGADVVEVCPTAIGAAATPALVGSRIFPELLTGIAVRRAAGHAAGRYPVQVA